LVAVPLDVRGMSVRQPIKEDEWVDASASDVQLNDLRLRVVDVRVGTLDVQHQGRKVPLPPRLLILVRASYEGMVFKLVPYEPWVDLVGAPSKNPATLTDHTGRAYPQQAFDPAWKIVGRPPAPAGARLPVRGKAEWSG